MRRYLPLVVSVLFSASGISQSSSYFENVWHGYNTGDYLTGRFPSAIRVADLDNDGDPDVVSSQGNLQTGFVVLLSEGNGSYSMPVFYASPLASYDISVADFNADGWKDVVVSNGGSTGNGNSISVFLNSGNAVFALTLNITVGLGPVGLATADLDGDGDPDIAVCNSGEATVSTIINNGNGTFGPVQSFPAGDVPYKIVASRINTDGLTDLVVANEGNQKMNVLFNTGNAGFLNKVEYNVMSVWGGDFWSCVESGDLDNDGDNDVLYSSSKTYDGNRGYIACFKNNGDGTLAPPQGLPFTLNSGGGTDIEIADLNGDGWKDIIGNYFSGGQTDNIQLLMNNGSGGFLPSVSRPAGSGTFSLAGTDVNSDGKTDIITLDRLSMQITVHTNQGGGTFPMPITYSTSNGLPGAMDAADIDGDGDLDIVTSASSIAAIGVKVTVAKNNGNGSFMPAVVYSIGAGGIRAKFRDLNGDGKPDLVFATSIASPPYDFHTAINNGDGTFGPRQTWPMNSCGWSDIEAVDLDNDGDRDVVEAEWLGCPGVPLAGRRIFISRNNGNGTFASPLIKTVNPHPGCIGYGDFNRDGNIDLVTGHSMSLDIHLGTGTGDLQPPVSYATEQSPYTLLVRDLNADGNLDVATCTEFAYEGMSVLLGNGNGTFQAAQNYFGAYISDLRNESGITSGDIDGDGDIDIMVSNGASNDLSIYLNDGTGHFVFRSRVGVYYGAAAPIFADFTGDCKADLAAAVSIPFNLFDGGAVTVLKGSGVCAVLPVRLLRIKAIAEPGGIKVVWDAADEINLSKYEVEKSRDGNMFIKAGEVVPGNSMIPASYSFLDNNPNTGSNYYRLKMINTDGSYKYSAVVWINLKSTDRPVMTITPNPANGQTSVFISGKLSGRASIDVYDLGGRMIANLFTGQLNGTAFTTTLNISTLKEGVYILYLTVNDEKISEKLVVY